MKTILKISLHIFFLSIILFGGCLYKSLQMQSGFRFHCREMLFVSPSCIKCCRFVFQKDNCKTGPDIFVSGLNGSGNSNARYQLYRLDGTLIAADQFCPRDNSYCKENGTVYFFDMNLTRDFRRFPDEKGFLEVFMDKETANNVVIMLRETYWFGSRSPWRKIPCVPMFHTCLEFEE